MRGEWEVLGVKRSEVKGLGKVFNDLWGFFSIHLSEGILKFVK